MIRYLCFGLIAASLVLAVPDATFAKDKGKGKPAHAQKGGKGPKAVPPGQIKRYTRGAKVPSDVRWEDIDDLSNWKLPPPGKGNKYIKIDNEILEIAEDTQTVIDAVGIVGDLMK